jgi:hypothetical protein
MKDFEYFQSKYPTLFPSYPRCGFDLPEGWETLFEDLCQKLSALPNPPTCAQVKEKFGGLRFYTDYVVEEADALISAAEKESVKTCQSCGSKDNVKNRGGGWIVNLCEKCGVKL